MKKLIFILLGLYIHINSCTQQKYYEFYPTDTYYYNKTTNYTWALGGGGFKENVKITYSLDEGLFTIKSRDYSLLKPEIHEVVDVKRTESEITLLSSELYVIVIKDFATHTEIFLWNPAENAPPGSKEKIVFTTGRLYYVPK